VCGRQCHNSFHPLALCCPTFSRAISSCISRNRRATISGFANCRTSSFALLPQSLLFVLLALSLGLPAFAIDSLRRHVSGREPGLLLTTRTGTYIGKSNFVRKDWKPLLKSAEAKYRKFHTLRHTHASRLLAAGVDPAEVARRIGDSIETLMRSYAHWITTTGRDTAAKVDAIYGNPGPRLAKLEAEKETPDVGSSGAGTLKGAVRGQPLPLVAVS
jgi:hypothetical protein